MNTKPLVCFFVVLYVKYVPPKLTHLNAHITQPSVQPGRDIVYMSLSSKPNHSIYYAIPCQPYQFDIVSIMSV